MKTENQKKVEKATEKKVEQKVTEKKVEQKVTEKKVEQKVKQKSTEKKAPKKVKQAELELVKNLGNYETAKIRLIASVSQKETAEEVISNLNEQIFELFGNLYSPKKSTPTPTPPTTPTPTTPTPPTTPNITKAVTSSANQKKPFQYKRDDNGKIIIEFSFENDSLFQQLKRAVKKGTIEIDNVRKMYNISDADYLLLNSAL